MESYENNILNFFDAVDDCENCPNKNDCKSQCSEVQTVYNPQILQMLASK